jgi:lysophospholipase L1-like esterase
MGTTTYCYQITQLPALKGKVTWVQNWAKDASDSAHVTTDYTTASGSPSATVKSFCQAAGTTYQKVFYVVDIGTNDLDLDGYSASAIMTTLHSVWSTAKADGCTVIANTVMPRANGSFPLTSGQEAQRQILNNSIRADNGYDYLIDLDQVLNVSTASSTFSNDGLHPTSAGHLVIARELNKVLVSGGGSGQAVGNLPFEFLETSSTLASNSDSRVPTSKAVRALVGAGSRPFQPIITLAVPLTSSATVLAYTMPASPSITVTIPANCTGSTFADTVTATASTTFVVKHNGTTVCTGTVAAAGSTLSWGTGGSSTTYTAGDVLTVVYSGDATLVGGLALAGSF